MGAGSGGLIDSRNRRLKIAQAPAISNGVAYAAKDVIGVLLTFANAARAGVLSGVLESVTIEDKGQQMAAMDLLLFSVTLAPAADNAIFAPTDADLATCIGAVPILVGDYKDLSTNSVAHVRPAMPYVLAGTSLFGVLVSRGTPTYTSTGDIVVTAIIRQD